MAQLDRMVAEGFVGPAHRDSSYFDDQPDRQLPRPGAQAVPGGRLARRSWSGGRPGLAAVSTG